MADNPSHPVRAREALDTRTPAGVVGNSATGLAHMPSDPGKPDNMTGREWGLSHMPTLPRPDTHVIFPNHPANHLQERLHVVPVSREE